MRCGGGSTGEGGGGGFFRIDTYRLRGKTEGGESANNLRDFALIIGFQRF